MLQTGAAADGLGPVRLLDLRRRPDRGHRATGTSTGSSPCGPPRSRTRRRTSTTTPRLTDDQARGRAEGIWNGINRPEPGGEHPAHPPARHAGAAQGRRSRDQPGAAAQDLSRRPVSAPEATVPRGVIAQGAQEVDAAELRPVGLGEPDLRVGALPQQESRKPLLPRCADDQVGVGLAGGVEVLVDGVDGDRVDQFVGRITGSDPDRRAAIAPRRRSPGARRSRRPRSRWVPYARRTVLRRLEPRRDLIGQQIERADDLHPPVLAGRGDLLDDVGNDLEQAPSSSGSRLRFSVESR